MGHQNSPTTRTAITGNKIAATVTQPDTIDLSVLLERCRGDLHLMDSLLCDMERSSLQFGGHDRDQLVRIDQPEDANAPRVMNKMIAGLGADSVRRVADDIENLYRSASETGVQEMLGDLQANMVRCLKFLPASLNLPRN